MADLYKDRISDTPAHFFEDDQFMDACEASCFDCGLDFTLDPPQFGGNLGRGVSLCKHCLRVCTTDVVPLFQRFMNWLRNLW